MKFSRHARNNMRLYKITEQDIMETIRSPNHTDREDGKLIAVKKCINRFSGYVLKVVYKKSEEEIMIITAYPLKKKHWR